MSEYVCMGDVIGLFCEETEGYLFNWQTSSTHNSLHCFHWQHRDKPNGIPNPQGNLKRKLKKCIVYDCIINYVLII